LQTLLSQFAIVLFHCRKLLEVGESNHIMSLTLVLHPQLDLHGLADHPGMLSFLLPRSHMASRSASAASAYWSMATMIALDVLAAPTFARS